MFYDILDWIEYWTAIFYISAVEWLQRTTRWAGNWFLKAWEFYDHLWGRIVNLTDVFNFNWIQAAIVWAQVFGEVFQYRYFWVREIFVDLLQKLYTVFVTLWDYLWEFLDTLRARWILIFRDLWDRVNKVFTDWWTLVSKWFTDWAGYLITLFEQHKAKIEYCLTDGWPRVVWFVIDRFEDLFGVVEGHIVGWQTFVGDPAQALWDWIEPRIRELVANFLVRVW